MKKLARAVLALTLLAGSASLVAQQSAAAPVQQQESTGKVVQQDEKAIFTKSPSVVAFGKKLGMNADQASTLFLWINFALFAAAILVVLGKLLPKTFRSRTALIQKGIVEARSATEEATARLAEVEARLARLDGEIAALREQAEKDAAADEARIHAAVEEETHRILHAAEQEIAAAQTHAERSLREYAASLAVQQAVAQMQITPDQDSALVREFAGRLSKEDAN